MSAQFPHTCRPLACLVALVCFVVASAAAMAQPVTLQAEFETVSIGGRSSAPLQVDWKFTSYIDTILGGRLVMEVSETPDNMLAGSERPLLARFVFEDVVFPPGSTPFSMQIPPIDSNSTFNELDLKLTFIAEQTEYDLGTFPYQVSQPLHRSFVVCFCEPAAFRRNTSITQGQQGIGQLVRFENIEAERLSSAVTTTTWSVVPDDMPDDPLLLCRYDMVVLVREALPELTGRQFEALQKWIAAGGSACVFLGSKVDANQVAFLNSLLEPVDDLPRFAIESDGTLFDALADEKPVETENDDPRIMLRAHELGRVAVVDPPGFDSFENPTDDLRRMFGFLWKARRDQLASVARTGSWQVSARSVVATWRNPYDTYYYGPVLLDSSIMLIRALFPKSIDVVPLTVMLGTMLVYVAIIGPVDYFLLGFFRKRKWTWITFPIVTLCFAGFALGMSNSRMATSEDGGSLQVIDIGQEGNPLRRSTFDLLFVSRTLEVEHEYRNQLFTPIAVDELRTRPRTADIDYTTADIAPPEYVGRFPQRYTVLQQVPQWTPMLNRVTEIAPELDMPEFERSGVTIDDIKAAMPAIVTGNSGSDRGIPTPSAEVVEAQEQAAKALTDLKAKLLSMFGDQTVVYVLYGDRFDRISDPQKLKLPAAMNASDILAHPEFLRDICVRQDGGFFSLVSQISPTGGSHFEDLAILDPADSEECLVVAVTKTSQSDFVIYRKLYNGAD